MRRVGWAAYLWPGLPNLWQYGSWSGLLLALVFAAVLNLTLVTWLVWTDWLSPWLQHSTRLVLLFTWTAGVAWSVRSLRRESRLPASPAVQDLFASAQSQYLRGNWFEAEVAINRLLRASGRDVDAHLMLATLLRHTGRLQEARQQIRRLQLLEGARKWSMEIGRELRRLDAAEAEMREAAAEDVEVGDGPIDEQSPTEHAQQAA